LKKKNISLHGFMKYTNVMLTNVLV